MITERFHYTCLYSCALLAVVFFPCMVLATGEVPPLSPEQKDTVTITSYRVEGNTLLSNDEIEQAVAPFTGENRSYTDIQKTMEVLDALYRSKGYSAVHVYLPEQEIINGVVIFKVMESVIGEITVSGNQHHDETNILAGLPALRVGAQPNARVLSENTTLSNQNPAKQVSVTLGITDPENIEARVVVNDEKPWKLFSSLDDTGNRKTGDYRLGVGFQHANLFNRDHVVTLNYITSPGHADKVSIYGASYRFPLYPLGDSVDAIFAYSDVNSGSTATVAGPLAFSGSGRIYGLRYNLNLARRGEVTRKFIFGFDWRAYVNNCTLGVFGSAGCASAAADVTVHPLSLTYAGDWLGTNQHLGYSLEYSHNIPGGSKGNDEDFAAARPSPLGIGGADADFQIIKGSLDYTRPLFSTRWLGRIAARWQYTPDALVTVEQFGLAGASAVRGFEERELSRDKGYVLNAEFYTPELGKYLWSNAATLQALVFLDHAQGWNNTLAGDKSQPVSITSTGLGMRVTCKNNLSLQFDLARVLDDGDGRKADDLRGHLNVLVSY